MRTDAYLGGRIERPVPGGEEDSILQSGSGNEIADIRCKNIAFCAALLRLVFGCVLHQSRSEVRVMDRSLKGKPPNVIDWHRPETSFTIRNSNNRYYNSYSIFNFSLDQQTVRSDCTATTRGTPPPLTDDRANRFRILAASLQDGRGLKNERRNAMAEAQLTLYEKLQKIRKIAEVAQKDADGYGYKYATITNILAKVTAGMNKYNVLLIPQMEKDAQYLTRDEIRETKVRKDGTPYEKVSYEYRFESPIIYRWIDVEEPEVFIDVPWFITGSQKDPSQATGSAMTYGMRYFLTQFFQIATPEDDPDKWRSQQREAEAEENAEVAQAIINELHKFVIAHVEEHPDDRDEIIKLTKKYATKGKKSSSNYFDIKDPDVATQLYAEIKEKFDKPNTTKKAAKE